MGREARNVVTHIFGGLTHEHESLSVGNDLGGVESLFKVIDELALVAVEDFFLRTRDDFASPDTLLLEGRQTPSEDGFSDQGDYIVGVSNCQEGKYGVPTNLEYRPLEKR